MRPPCGIAAVAALCSLILLAGCVGQSGSEIDPETGLGRWVVEEDLRIGQMDGPDEYVFAEARNILAAPGGGIWVLESRIPELRLYDAAGEFVRRVGQRGEGPGEFAGNVCAYAGPDGEVWVEDSRGRWQRFDGTGVLLGSVPVTSNLGCGIRQWTDDGRFLVVNTYRTAPPPAPSRAYFVEHRLTAAGDLLQADTFWTPDIAAARTVEFMNSNGVRMIMPIPFTHRPTWILGPSGGFWSTQGDGRYLIQRSSLTGDSLFVIERAYTPVPIPDAERAASFDRYQPAPGAGGVLDVGEVPRVYPPFDRFSEATDGTLYVWRQLEGGRIGLDVFSAAGEYLGQAETPTDFDRVQILSIDRDHMYGVARDEYDIPYVVRLAIHRPDP